MSTDAFQSAETVIGWISVTANPEGLTRVFLTGKVEPALKTELPPASHQQAGKIANAALAQILEYLQGKRQQFEIPFDWSAVTSFQQRVLKAALEIPFGEIRTYGQLAAAIAKNNASRAVGAALGRNPMPILIPCHRVVAADGHLTGFSAADGLRTKQWLLELEGHRIERQKLG